MPFRLRRSLCVTLASLSLPGIALADTGYLTWKHKSDAQPATVPAVSSGGQDYPVPPSPYGQVGDPFAHTLSWSGKDRSQSIRQQPQPAEQQAPQPQTRPVAASPAEPPRQQLATVEPLPVPQHPIPQVTAPVPVPQPRPVTVPPAAVKPEPRPQPAPQAAAPQRVPPQQAPAPVAATKPAPPPAAPQVQPAPAQPAPAQVAPAQAASNGYQVPATSKYAARIASARAAATKQEADATQTPAKTAPAKPTAKAGGKTTDAKATVPPPSPQLATEETDHVFIPGEQYKNATDAPRLYSLHRAYGLTPDPITVDHNATGAILDTADLDKVEEAPDDTAKDDTASSHSSKTEDSSAKTAAAPTADTRKVTK